MRELSTTQESSSEGLLAGTDASSPNQKHRWAHRMWNVGRVLATIAAISWAYAMWTPWVIVRGYTDRSSADVYTLMLGPADLQVPGGMVEWHVATILGLCCCVLFWQRTLSSVALLGATVYVPTAGFMESAATFSVPTAQRVHANGVLLLPGAGPEYLIVNPIQQLPGYYLFNVSVPLAFVAALMLVISLLMLRDEFHSAVLVRSATRPAYSVASSHALLAGILLWALGALVLPWRAGSCAWVPFVAQSCAPGGFGDMLQRGLSGDLALLNPRIGMYALPALLVYLALLALAGLWRRVPLRLLATWTSLWLAGSSVALAFALRGLLMTRPVAFGAGLVVAFVGLFLAACGLAWLYAQAPASPDLPDQLALG